MTDPRYPDPNPSDAIITRSDQLEPTDVFVFGSNLAGRHGRGAARAARQAFGFPYGRGEGLVGRAYALPTKDERLRTLGLGAIGRHVDALRDCIAAYPARRFVITPVGCGLAGYAHADIAPLFTEISSLPNITLPTAWRGLLT